MKVLITGAHFTPAQAMIEELQKYPEAEIVYVGRKHTLEDDKALSAESQILPELGVKFIPIIAGRLRRFISVGTIVSLLKIPVGFIQGFWVVLTENPQVVVSFGGYVGVPIVFAAWLLDKPVLIHDQTLVFGLASTISAFFATKIAVTFNKTYPFPPQKIIITGNPLRKAILDSPTQVSPEFKRLAKEKKKLILITAGNQGSHFFNGLVGEILPKLTENFILVHQTGDSKFKDYDRLIEQRAKLKHQSNYLVYKFIKGEEMSWLMRHSDLVVSRAGVNTLLELSFLSIPTIIIPIPYVQKDEQTVNAKYFSQAGLGLYLSQLGLTSQKLLTEIKKVIKNSTHYQHEAKRAKSVVIEDATPKIVQQILLLTHHHV